MSARAQALGARVEVATPVPTTSAGAQEAGALRFDGDLLYAAYSDFAGTRVAAIDPALGTVTELGVRPPLPTACVGTVCLVERTAEVPGTAERDNQLWRVRPDGTEIDAAPILTRRFGLSTFFVWRFARAGTGFLLLTSEYDTATTTYSHTFRTITTTGASPVGSARTYAGPSAYPELACTASRCGLLWGEFPVVRFAVVGLDGMPTATPVVTLASSTSGFLLLRATSTEFRAITDTLYEIDMAGTVRTPAAGMIPALPVRTFECAPGGACLVLGPAPYLWVPGSLSPGPGLPFGVVPFSAACGATWCAMASQDPTIRTVHISVARVSTGAVTDDAVHFLGALDSPQLGPVMLAGHVALFHRWVGGRYQLLSVALADGAPMGPAVEVEADLMWPVALRAACVAGDEAAAVIASPTRGVSLVRFGPTGAPLDTPSFIEVPPDRPVAVAWNGVHYLVAWIDAPNTLYMRRYDAVGQRVDETPRRVRDGAVGLALVQDTSTMGWFLFVDTSSGIRASLVGSDGVPGASDVVVRDGPTARMTASRIEGGALVAWYEAPMPFEAGDVRTAVFSSAGVTPLGGRRLFTASVGDLALGGTTGRTLLWRGAPVGSFDDAYRVMTLDRTGAASSPEEVVHLPTTGLGTPIGAFPYASVGMSPTTILFNAVDPPSGPVPARGSVWARTYADGSPPGDTCGAPTDCTSGVCAAGICCDRPCDGACEACGTGTCSPRPAGSECRAATGMCDLAETCDGTGPSCPAPVTTDCDAPAGDAGTAMPDAGGIPDAGGPDASGAVDAGGGGSGGCSATAHARSSPIALLALCAAWMRRRRLPARA